MFWKISTKDGVAAALKQLFAFLLRQPRLHVVYINCSSSSALQVVARMLPHPEMLRHFDYQRVSSVGEMVEHSRQGHPWLVIEHMDAIAQEPSGASYAELNRDICALMNSSCNVVFLDDWLYLDQYWHRQPVDVRV